MGVVVLHALNTSRSFLPLHYPSHMASILVVSSCSKTAAGAPASTSTILDVKKEGGEG